MALFSLVIVICAVLPSIFGQCTLSTASLHVKRPVYHFSVDLSTRLAQEKENHFISSPLSQWVLISVLSNGATDETLEDIARVLMLHPHKCFNKKYWEILKTIFETQDVTIAHSTMIAIDENVPVKDTFLLNVQETALCEIATENFEDNVAIATKLNDYVNENTNGVIEDLVVPNDFTESSIVLLDALYFKGTWTKSFSRENTERLPFYNEIGNRIGEVNMMYMHDEVNYTVIDQIQARVVQLPYGNNKDYSMLVFLPTDENRLSSVIYKMKTISLATIFKKFEMDGSKTLTVQIPRFKITSELDNLKELLSDMGLRSMFDSQAKFLDVADDILYVTNVLQKASIEVTEEGTEAAAATEIGLGWRSLGEEFVANRPFYFMIVNCPKQIPLFVGAYSKPTLH